MRDPRIRIVDEFEIQLLPQDLLDCCPRKDVYLVELAAVSNDKTIITTDTELAASVDGKHGLRVILLENFLASYLT
jgi:predicted nucleic acid-binding protein